MLDMIAPIPELLPGFIAGVAVFIYFKKRFGEVKNDMVALASAGIVVLGSLLFDSPVAWSGF